MQTSNSKRVLTVAALDDEELKKFSKLLEVN